MNYEKDRVLTSIVIPSARKSQVNRTISCLALQTLDPKHYEILVVTPGIESFDPHPMISVRILSTAQLFPPGKMRNIGAKGSRGEYIFFIDDDCLPPPEWLEKTLLTFHKNQGIGAIGCRVVSAHRGFWNRCADFALFGTYQYDRYYYRDIGSAAIAVRRKAYEDSGGFNEALYASEDWDFNFRLKKNGWKTAFIPDVEVLHNHGRGSVQGILKQAFNSGAYSGLTAQMAHIDQLSFLARLSVKMGSPWFYWLFIFPYALAIAGLQIIEQKKSDKRFWLFIPMIFIARCCFQFGVWITLINDAKSKK